MTSVLSCQKLSVVSDNKNIGYTKRFLCPEFPNKMKESRLTTFASRQANSFVHTLFYVASFSFSTKAYFSLPHSTLLLL